MRLTIAQAGAVFSLTERSPTAPQLDEPSRAEDRNMFINSLSIRDKDKVAAKVNPGNPDETAGTAGHRPGSRYTYGKAQARSGYAGA